MPFVRIDITQTIVHHQADIADAVHAALVESIAIPVDDRFQVVSVQGSGMIYNRTFLDVARSDAMIMVEIHLSIGRSLELKRALYKAIADKLVALGLRREDVLIHLMETTTDNWSFGNGMAQYADRMPQHLSAR